MVPTLTLPPFPTPDDLSRLSHLISPSIPTTFDPRTQPAQLLPSLLRTLEDWSVHSFLFAADSASLPQPGPPLHPLIHSTSVTRVSPSTLHPCPVRESCNIRGNVLYFPAHNLRTCTLGTGILHAESVSDQPPHFPQSPNMLSIHFRFVFDFTTGTLVEMFDLPRKNKIVFSFTKPESAPSTGGHPPNFTSFKAYFNRSELYHYYNSNCFNLDALRNSLFSFTSEEQARNNACASATVSPLSATSEFGADIMLSPSSLSLAPNFDKCDYSQSASFTASGWPTITTPAHPYDFVPFRNGMAMFRGEYFSVASKVRSSRTMQCWLASQTRVEMVPDSAPVRTLCDWAAARVMEQSGSAGAAWGGMGKEIWHADSGVRQYPGEVFVAGPEESSVGAMVAESDITSGHGATSAGQCEEWPHVVVGLGSSGAVEAGGRGNFSGALMDELAPTAGWDFGRAEVKSDIRDSEMWFLRECKLEERKEKNREAARKSNKKKRDHRLSVQGELNRMKEKEAELRGRERDLRKENRDLKRARDALELQWYD